MLIAIADGRWLRLSGETSVEGSYPRVEIRSVSGLEIEDNNDASTFVAIEGDTGSIRHLDLRGLTGAGAYVFWSVPGDKVIRGSRQGDYLYAYGGGNDRLSGSAGADFLFGNDGDDRTYGGSGGDEIEGGDGDDVLAGGRGADLVNGGAGFDTLVLRGLREEYDLEVVEGDYVLRHARGDRYDRTDTFANIETLQFADQTMSIDDFLI